MPRDKKISYKTIQANKTLEEFFNNEKTKPNNKKRILVAHKKGK